MCVYWIGEIITSVAACMCNWLVTYLLHGAESFLRR